MLNYPLERERLQAFLVNYLDPETNELKYMKQLEAIANRQRTSLDVELDDLSRFYPDGELAANATRNARRYARLLADAADAALPPPTVGGLAEDVFDVLARQRTARQAAEAAAGGPPVAADPANRIPAELLRRYQVCLRPGSDAKATPLRAVGAPHIGALVRVRGVATHVTDVRPLLSVATYLDDATGVEAYQEVLGRSFMPLTSLPAGAAKRAGGGGAVGGGGGGGAPAAASAPRLQTRGSKFVRFQELRLQELPLEVPTGGTPRSLTVHLRGDLTRLVKPGDEVEVTGAFLPEARGGPGQSGSARNAGGASALLARTFLEATAVAQAKESYDDAAADATLAASVDGVASTPDVYSRLAAALAPEIFGHDDVKKALLLALVGGTGRVLGDGMKLRGNIHLCLMGDPGVAKSQLLKHVAHLAPRALYTTGKGSSGVGLTAAVTRDPATGEAVLEGGALVLADGGVCCIDEFDKMDEGDRTAIHEVMEQQTVSIAKAGILTTLNTRTTVLAAANPAWGRYDVRRSPAENIALPAALLSRFDLMWLILDSPDAELDRRLAVHVLGVHNTGAAPVAGAGAGAEDGVPATAGRRGRGRAAAAAAAAAEAEAAPLPARVLRGYLARAKSFEPTVPRELTEYIAAIYAEMRDDEARARVPHSYTTARTLLSILRLATALARLRFAGEVGQAEVDEALRLMRMSKHSLLDGGAGGGVGAAGRRANDPVSAVYYALRDAARASGTTTYAWADLVALLGRSFSHDAIRAAVEEYAEYNVLSVEYPRPNEPTVHFA